MSKILIVEDEFIIAQDLSSIISDLGHAVMGRAKSFTEAINKIETEIPDLILVDINISGEKKGTDLAKVLTSTYDIPFIYITSLSDRDTLIEIKATNPIGYILKPFDKRDIRVALELATVHNQHTKINSSKIKVRRGGNLPKDETFKSDNLILGESDAILKTLDQVKKVSFTDVTVLIEGETGTGKELIMEYLHESSPRKDKPLVKVNCAALPNNLIESVLFGHEKGSFTGATEKRIGKFEQANGGTLFLDEIGELPLSSQSKLLRSLQEKEIETVGGIIAKKINVRIIAATNRNLEKEVQSGHFRADLYFRLCIFPISVPPLRDRNGDILLLANYFKSKFSKQINKIEPEFNKSTIKEINNYSWPGNIRELQHFVERGVLLSESGVFYNSLEGCALKDYKSNQEFELKSLEDVEREQIIQTLKYCNGKVRGKGGAAEILKLNPSTLDFRIKKLGITKANSYH